MPAETQLMNWTALCGCDKVPFWVDPRNVQSPELAGLVLLAAAAGLVLTLYLMSVWRNRHYDRDY